jgi:hypothetical protein
VQTEGKIRRIPKSCFKSMPDLQNSARTNDSG